MRTNRSLLSILLLATIAFPSYSQTYSGKVVDDSTKEALAGASACLTTSDGTLVGWSITNKDGGFSLKMPEGKSADSLQVSCLGYTAITMPVRAFKSGDTVSLKSETFHLEEVKVSASRIVQRRDTLVYSVAGFAQPQDKSISDVIAKMPGMEVASNGQISFNGKAINKFYIEGLDLMNNHYALASENISRKRIKSVEVLQNHQPVELLRGKSFSEQAAINLVLEDESRMNLVGSADLGLGANKNELLYENRLMAMLFGKKNQNLSIYKNDNRGNDLFSEINPLTISDLTKENFPESDMISAIRIDNPDIDASRYLFNKSHLVATNHLTKVTDKTTLRVQAAYFNDISKQRNHLETEYFLSPEAGQTDIEDHCLNQKLNRLDANLDLEVNKANLYIKNELSGTFDWVESLNTTTLNGKSRSISASPDKLFVSDVFDLKTTLGENRYISFRSTNTYNHLPQSLSLYSGEMQKLDYTSFYTHTTASLNHQLWIMRANYQWGLKGLFQEIASFIHQEMTITNQAFHRYIPYAGANLQYDNGTIRLEADAKINWLNWNYDNATKEMNHNSFYPSAKFRAEYAISGTSQINLNYHYTGQLQDIRSLYEGELFTSYRTVTSNTWTTDFDNTHQASIRYQYSNPIKGLFMSASASTSATRKSSAYETTIDALDNLIMNKRLPASYHSNVYLLDGKVSKSFGRWKSLLNVSGSYMKTSDAQYYDGVLKDYDLDSYSANISFSARPVSFFSLELESSWRQTNLKSPMADSKINQLIHHAHLTFPVTQKLRLDIDNAVYQSLETDEASWFADCSISYTHKQMEFQFLAYNIMGKSLYEREFISSIQRSYYRYTLRPREFMAKFTFSF